MFIFDARICHLKQDLHVAQKIEHYSDSLRFRTITRVAT